MEGFLYQATIYLLAAVIAVPIAARLGLGSVLGYLAAGIIIGPALHLVGQETHSLQSFAEFGVVMMLFLIGLELEPRALWNMRHKLLGLGGLQVVLTGAAVMGAGMVLGLEWREAMAVGMILALSSTAIVLQTLSEKGLIQTQGGRSAFAVLLTQDIAVIPMIAFLPLLALAPAEGAALHGASEAPQAVEAARSLIDSLPGWGATLVTLGAVAVVVLSGAYLVGPVFRFIHAARLPEMYTAFALAIVIGIAFVMTLVGLSPALGTFLAGVVLANSPFRHELESDIQPFKGLLLGLFFITVGAGIDFSTLFGDPLPIIGMAVGVMALKWLILCGLGLIFRLRRRNLMLFTLALAQAGEFGFVLVSFSERLSVLPSELAARVLLAITLTMLMTPLVFILYDVLSRRMAEGGPETREADTIEDRGPVIIAGIGRFGQIVNRMVQSSGFETVVLDHDMTTIELMRRFGFKGYFGDPTRPDILHAAGLQEARVLVAAMDSPEAVTQLVSYARAQRPDLHIIARAYDRPHVFRLYKAGADDIVRETFDSSLRAGRYVLENIGLTEFEAAEAEKIFFHHDRKAVRELAELWDPEVPTLKNAAYIARSKELQKDLEAALLAQKTDRDDAA
ncbi:monovalent cation:proton antiporter-2 (CPA2) family protein [Pseudooceanicola sp. CBS1P-1]|uniref:Potassium transporter n=1 Tax=Pseudooceanicola albus TaxID=2692189 RepID=A0A6L7G0G5_9RHOB|nr:MULTISPECIES: monovalent cation:proton antiporter-2 (CPA2) family protein [Pseudooceanicola]MBT9383727.1 monovalent cation:proton antiporter-2 (CPA2) family protein [Pseudooceanicola endophyticus]MXN17581.1 potassium transporter [Pseudooceanicola albus]